MRTDARPRVLHVIPALFGGDDGIVGGAERYVLELARHMARVTTTSLVSFGARDREERVGDLRVRVIGRPWYVRGSRFNPLSLRLVPELGSADVVHFHQQHVLTSSLGALAARALRRRVCVSDLGGGAWDLSAYLSTDRWFHVHLHISEYSRRHYGHAGHPWARVILGGVDANKFRPDPTARGGPRVLFVGRLLPHKGVDYLVRGMPAEIPLEVVGQVHDPSYAEYLRGLAAGKRVTFRHDCTDAELVRAYQRATCVVLPSVYRTYAGEATGVPELLGQTLLEGMACGAAALCTDVASMPEVVEDGVTGFVVPANDPEALGVRITELAQNPCLARQMGAAGRARVVERFTWDAVVARCLDAYDA